MLLTTRVVVVPQTKYVSSASAPRSTMRKIDHMGIHRHTIQAKSWLNQKRNCRLRNLQYQDSSCPFHHASLKMTSSSIADKKFIYTSCKVATLNRINAITTSYEQRIPDLNLTPTMVRMSVVRPLLIPRRHDATADIS